jgi:hypothetical protein
MKFDIAEFHKRVGTSQFYLKVRRSEEYAGQKLKRNTKHVLPNALSCKS